MLSTPIFLARFSPCSPNSKPSAPARKSPMPIGCNSASAAPWKASRADAISSHPCKPSCACPPSPASFPSSKANAGWPSAPKPICKKRGHASAPAGLPALHPTQCKIHPLAPCLPLYRSSLADRGGRPEGILCPFLNELNYTVQIPPLRLARNLRQHDFATGKNKH